jgi:hypothetical protein
MGSSTFSKHDYEMIEISWAFVRDKQLLGLNTMVKIFESSKEIKEMFKFLNTSNSINDMMENAKVRYHANQVVKTLNKIVIVLIKSSINEQDKELLVELGQRHYHYGLKKEYFIVCQLINYFLL